VGIASFSNWKTSHKASFRRFVYDRVTLRGQTLVEFAMIASVFLMLLFGIMQMALTVYNYNTVCSAAREAVRYAIVRSPSSVNPATSAQIQQVAVNNAVGLDPSKLTATLTWITDANLPLQKDAQVRVSYLYQLTIPFFSPVTLTLSSTAQMLVSQ
jgi:Flp pilus assembly protein TadG